MSNGRARSGTEAEYRAVLLFNGVPVSETLFSRRYDVGPEMLLDFLQQAMAGLPTVTSYELADSGDRIVFTTALTLTSWGENMVAAVEDDGNDWCVLSVSGEPRVGALSTPWGEELHAATIESQLFAALDPSIEMARTNPIVMLQADHRRVEALFARIAFSSDAQRAQLVQQLLTALRVHMELEETQVYPLLRSEVDADLAEEAEIEHQLARDGLAQLEELTPDEPGFDAALAMVMAGIEHHVVEEENDAFPRLVSHLGAERLAELATQLIARRADLAEREFNRRGTGGRTAPQRDKAETKDSRPPRPRRQSERARGPRNKPRTAVAKADEPTKADLIERAKKAGVSGYSHMSKAELVKAIAQTR
jgi:hemerythrin-like domain-containing protein